MHWIAASSMSVPAAAVLAGFLMVVAGVSKKLLHWRTVECPVCRRDRRTCTCRWL